MPTTRTTADRLPRAAVPATPPVRSFQVTNQGVTLSCVPAPSGHGGRILRDGRQIGLLYRRDDGRYAATGDGHQATGRTPVGAVTDALNQIIALGAR